MEEGRGGSTVACCDSNVDSGREGSLYLLIYLSYASFLLLWFSLLELWIIEEDLEAVSGLILSHLSSLAE